MASVLGELYINFDILHCLLLVTAESINNKYLHSIGEIE